jgi:hypothetical protein
MFCACPVFYRVFLLVVVPWLPDVTEGHLTRFRIPFDVRMRNRKWCNPCIDRWSRDPFGSVLRVLSTTSAEEEEVSFGVIMTNTEIKFHILLFTLSSSSVS